MVEFEIKGIEQTERMTQQLQQGQKEMNMLALLALREGANEIIRVAKNLAPTRTGRLRESLGILQETATDVEASIDIGSTIPGYPFFQEFGWTSRAGRAVPGKFFFLNAITATKPRFIELMQATIVANSELWGRMVVWRGGE